MTFHTIVAVLISSCQYACWFGEEAWAWPADFWFEEEGTLFYVLGSLKVFWVGFNICIFVQHREIDDLYRWRSSVKQLSITWYFLSIGGTCYSSKERLTCNITVLQMAVMVPFRNMYLSSPCLDPKPKLGPSDTWTICENPLRVLMFP